VTVFNNVSLSRFPARERSYEDTEFQREIIKELIFEVKEKESGVS